ncbi:MAG: peptidylprolyl isomerase [Pseudomonadota bacterium]|nr:peptidylprolyl isomerase [Pseudomonadota bacterium]HJO36959.1 peptidylprolyl isomerase [Gammaproteobacteria bacterium]
MKTDVSRLLALLCLLLPLALPAAELLDRVVAVVNDDVILDSELDEQVEVVRAQIAASGRQTPGEDVLRRQVLERMIVREVQLQRARDTGLEADDARVNAAIANIAGQNRQTPERFLQALAAQGISPATFREGLAGDLMIERLQQRDVGRRINVSEREIEGLLEDSGDDTQYRLQQILIAIPENAPSEEVQRRRAEAERVRQALQDGADFETIAASESDGQQALEGGDLGWRSRNEIPSMFAELVPQLEEGQISEIIRSPSGFHILRLAETRGGSRTMVLTETRARHILIQPDLLTSEADARREAEQVYRELQAGADFAALAREHSDDATSASRGGDLGWLPPGAVVPPFQQAMDALAPGELSEPFETRFGWHVVEVQDRRRRDATDQMRRAQAQRQLMERKMAEEVELWVRQLRDEAYVEIRLEPGAS